MIFCINLIYRPTKSLRALISTGDAEFSIKELVATGQENFDPSPVLIGLVGSSNPRSSENTGIFSPKSQQS